MNDELTYKTEYVATYSHIAICLMFCSLSCIYGIYVATYFKHAYTMYVPEIKEIFMRLACKQIHT